MNCPFKIQAVLSCFAVVALLTTDLTLADEPIANIGKELQSFGDKIVVISIEQTVGAERYSSSATLKNAKIITLGDRTFIRGIGYVAKVDEINEKIAWFNGVDASYAWDGVVDFYVFTPEQLVKYRKWVQQQED